jgi:hypothetical protein
MDRLRGCGTYPVSTETEFFPEIYPPAKPGALTNLNGLAPCSPIAW